MENFKGFVCKLRTINNNFHICKKDASFIFQIDLYKTINECCSPISFCIKFYWRKNMNIEIYVLPYFCDILWKVLNFTSMSHVLLPYCVCWRFLKHKSGTVYKLSIFQLHKTAFFTDVAFLLVVLFGFDVGLNENVIFTIFVWQSAHSLGYTFIFFLAKQQGKANTFSSLDWTNYKTRKRFTGSLY